MPAIMITAAVASSPMVSGSSTEMVATGPMPGTRAARQRAPRRAATGRASVSARTLAALLENMDQGVIMFDGDHRVVAHNSRVRAMLGLPEALMQGGTALGLVEHQLATGEY